MTDDRDWQNGFERYKQRLSSITTFKGSRGKNAQAGTALHHYVDLGAEVSDA